VPLSCKLVWCCPQRVVYMLSVKQSPRGSFLSKKKSAHHLNGDEEETRMEVGNDGRGLCPVTLMHGAGPNHLAQEMVPGDMILELKILLRPG